MLSWSSRQCWSVLALVRAKYIPPRIYEFLPSWGCTGCCQSGCSGNQPGTCTTGHPHLSLWHILTLLVRPLPLCFFPPPCHTARGPCQVPLPDVVAPLCWTVQPSAVSQVNFPLWIPSPWDSATAIESRLKYPYLSDPKLRFRHRQPGSTAFSWCPR